MPSDTILIIFESSWKVSWQHGWIWTV